MQMQFGLSSYKRARGDLAELPVVNFTAEEAAAEGKVILQSRPGISDRSADMGADAVEQVFRHDGVLSGGLFGVAGGDFYAGTTSKGTIDGSGTVSIAGYEDRVFVAAGGSLWGYNGTTLATIAVPDSANVTKVLVGSSRAIILRADTQQYYWSDVLSTTIGALSFSSAESQPDRLRDALYLDDTLILFGSETVEFHPNTGNADLPFQPLEGRVFEKGIRATGCATVWNGTFAWVGNDNVVYVNGQAPTPISDDGLNARIAASATCSLFAFILEGREYLALRLDDETQIFGQTWTEFQSYGVSNWIPQCYSDGVFGSAIDGKTLEWGSDNLDLGGVLERRFRGGFALNSGGVPIANILLRSNPGNTPYLTGTYADPSVEMRISRDAGNTWGSWRRKSLGAQGRYRKKLQWLACGVASQPGLLVEFRVSDPIDWRVSDVLFNEGYGGR